MNLYSIAKYTFLPGTLGFLLIGLALSFAALCVRRTARLGMVMLAVLVLGYWFMGTPAGASILDDIVSVGYQPISDPKALRDIDAIVVLDGGMARYTRGGDEMVVPRRISAVRALEAARLYRYLEPPLVIVTAGAETPVGKAPEGHAILDLLVTAGVPAERIVLDTEARNTREHAANVSALLGAKRVTRFALVTSAVHMRRAMRAFVAAGLKPEPAPAVEDRVTEYSWWPGTDALDRSFEAWYEVFGWIRDLAR